MLIDLTQYMWIVWLVFVFIFVIIELVTLEFTFLMLAAGSLGGLGANLLGLQWWLQILIAAVLSALLLFTIRPLLLRILHRGGDPTPSNVAALMGIPGRVLTPVSDIDGLVKLSNGETWTARADPSAGTAVIDEGAPVTVTAISGSTAIVIPVERNTGP